MSKMTDEELCANLPRTPRLLKFSEPHGFGLNAPASRDPLSRVAAAVAGAVRDRLGPVLQQTKSALEREHRVSQLALRIANLRAQSAEQAASLARAGARLARLDEELHRPSPGSGSRTEEQGVLAAFEKNAGRAPAPSPQRQESDRQAFLAWASSNGYEDLDVAEPKWRELYPRGFRN